MEDDLKQTVIKEQSAGKNVRKRTNKSPRKKRVIASKGKLDINKKTTVGNKISSFNPFLSESQKEILLNRLLTRLNKTVPDENKTHEDYKKRRTTFPNKSNVTLDRKLITSPANFSGSFDYPPVDETENYNMAYLEQKRQNVLRQILKEQEEKAKYPKTLFSKFTNLGKQLRREIYRDLSILYDEDTLFDNQTQNKKINDVIKLLSSEYSTQKKEKNPRNISNQGPKLNADERGLLERELIESSQRLKESLRYKKMNQRYPMREITKYYKSLYQITSHLLGDDLKMSPFEENENSLEMKLLISVMRLREKYHVSGITLQEVYKKIQHYQDEDEKKKEKIVVISETASVEDQCENKKPDEVKNRIDDKIKKLPKKHTKKMNKKQNIKKVEVKVLQNNVPNKTEKMEEKKSEPIVPIVTKFVRPSDLVDEKSDLSSKDSEFKEFDLKDLSLEEIIEHLKLRINEIDAAKKEKTEKTKPPSLCEIDVNNFIPLTELNLKQKNLDEVEPEPIRKVRDFLESLEPPENFVSSQNKKFVENNTKSISSSFKVTSKHYSIQFSNIVVSLEMKKTSNLLFNMKENKKILDEEEEKRQEQIDKDPFTLYILNKYLQLLTPDGNFTSYSLYPIEISPEAKISKQSNYLLDQIHANDGMIKRTTSQINRKNMAPVKKKKSFMKKCFRKYLKNNLFQRSMNSFQYNLKEIINLGNFNELVSNVPKRAEYGCEYIGTDKVLYSFIDHLKTYSEKSIKHFHDRSEIDVVELQTFLHSNLQRLSVNTLQTEMRSPVSKKSRSLNSGKNSRKSGSYIIPPGQVKCKNVPLIELPLKRMHQMTAKLMQSNQRIHERKDVALSSICLGRSNACCQTKSAPINDQTTQWLSTSSLSVYKSCASNIGSISQTHTLRDSQLFYPKKFTSRRNNYGSLNWHLANHSPDDVHALTKNSVYKKESHPPLKVLFCSRQFHQELNPKVYKKSRSFKQNDTPLARFVKTHGLPKLPHKWNWIKKHFTRENNRNRIFKKATIDMTLPITRRKEHILVNKLFRLGLTSAKLRAAGLFIDDVFHMAREFHTIAQKGIFCRDLTLKYGIRCKDLKAFGLCCRDLKHGITRDHLTAFGFTQDKLKQAGISEADLVQLGVKLEMLPGDDSSSSDDNYYCKMKDKKIFENKNKRKKSNKLNENSKKINFNEKEQIRRRADKTGSGKWPIAAMFATKRRFVRIDDNNVTIRMLHRTFGDIIPTPPKEMPGTMSFQELK